MPTASLTVAIALAAGVLAQSVSRQLHIPGIILLLVVGAYLGPDGLGWIAPAALGDGLFGIVEFGVAVILFEGGLNLEWSRLKRQEASIRRLITIGAVTTLVGGTLLVRLALGSSFLPMLVHDHVAFPRHAPALRPTVAHALAHVTMLLLPRLPIIC